VHLQAAQLDALFQDAGRVLQKRLRRLAVYGFTADQRHVGIRRQLGEPAFGQRAAGELPVAALQQLMQQRMLRVMGLDQHRARARAAPGPAGYLHQQLRQFFRSAEVRRIQAFIDTDHADETEHRQIMAFGQDLGADQNAGILPELTQLLLQAVLLARALTVDADARKARKNLLQGFLKTLGAEALRLQR